MGVPLAALSIQQPDPIEKLQRAVALKSMVQNQQYQQQAQPLELEQQQQQIEAHKRQLANIDAQTKAWSSWDRKDPQTLFDSIIKNGGDAQGATQTVEGLSKMRKDASDADEAKLNQTLTTNKIISGHLASVEKSTDKNAAMDAAVTDLEKKGIVQPGAITHQYPGDDKFAALKTLHMTQEEIAKEEDQKRQVARDAQLAQHEKAMEGAAKGEAEKYIKEEYLPANHLPDTPENRMKGYNEWVYKNKTAPAEVRVNALGNTREYPVIDTQNNNTLQYMSATDLNAANKATPGRYAPAGQGATALNKTALVEDIRGNVQQVRASLDNPKMPEFDAAMRAQIAVALRSRDPRSSISSLVNSEAAKHLTPEQQDYLIDTSLLVENAMAMRSVLGAGQGSEDLRNAIMATIPGPTTPTKEYAKKQLATFEKTLDRLARGIPSVPLKGNAPPIDKGNNAAPEQPPGATHTGVGSVDKKKHWLDANGKDLGLAE